MIERSIIIALITSTEFIQRIQDVWNVKLLESKTAKKLAMWVMAYYKKYNKAPGKDIEPIFYTKSKNLPKDEIEDIQEILEGLSEDWESNSVNVDYLVDEVKLHLERQSLVKHAEKIQDLLEKDKLLEARKLASTYVPQSKETFDWVDLSDPKVLERVETAFNEKQEPLIKFPGAFGEFINSYCVRGGFIAFMGREKLGKTQLLRMFGMQAVKKPPIRNVVFIQAGDMSTNEQIIRIAIQLAKKSNDEKYCKKHLEPVKDCVYNQNDMCKKAERTCTFGPFVGKVESYLRKEITSEEIKEAFEENRDYVPCTDCSDFSKNKWATTWVKEISEVNPLSLEAAKNEIEKFFIKSGKHFRIMSFPTGSLTVEQVDSILEIWEKEDGFTADVLLWDYPDIMEEESVKEHRHKQNRIWMKIRGLGQKRKCLNIAVTQTDANAYDVDLLTMKNFSEDKRKYAHPTAFVGMNQDPKGREKELGILRLNMILAREGDFNSHVCVHILQNLRRGLPLISSYW